MKKVLSVVLAALLVACCLPFSVFAASSQETLLPGAFDELDSTSPNYKLLQSDMEYIIPSGTTVTIPSGRTVYVPSNARLTVMENGILNVLGSIVVLNFGSIYADGMINGSDGITLGGNGAAAMVQFRFPDLDAAGVNLQDKITVSATYDTYTENPDHTFSTTTENDNDFYQSSPQGKSIYVPLNTQIKIYAHINEPDAVHDKFDDSLLKVSLNGVGLSYVTGDKIGTGYFTTKATTGGAISFAKWTNDSDFLTTKKIILPSGEGYECVPRYPDQVQKTQDGTIVVKYGDPFSFKVELDEAYDMSSYEVYIYNGYGWLDLQSNEEHTDLVGFKAIPDEYGYYNVPSVNGDLTISVTGVMKNSTISLIGNLMETFRNIFNMLKEFIDGLMSMFNGMNAG